ncbi:MAG: 30S ribosomal protein S20 [Deltaproteobacteria bacterium CG11_big_fil_rev_8_21_14_0_20_45_16]|nr:MAG: 30S ribosomal protein S20 [Deltaproteobacteria bacterium CG11_big_fil_rev_8_21_14_0_20_45_16]
MANHKSAEKRARQSIKRTTRNRVTRSAVKTATKTALNASGAEKEQALRNAFSTIQKAKSVLHRNTIKRKMARLAKALSQTKS